MRCSRATLWVSLHQNTSMCIHDSVLQTIQLINSVPVDIVHASKACKLVKTQYEAGMQPYATKPESE